MFSQNLSVFRPTCKVCEGAGVTMRGQQEVVVSRSRTITLTEEQCRYLMALFRERLESHDIREKSGYPQDEQGARLAKELCWAFEGAAPRDNGNAGGRGRESRGY